MLNICDRGRVFGVATRHTLENSGFESLFILAIFPVLIQIGSEAPSSYRTKTCIVSLYCELKRPVRGIDHTSLPFAHVIERVELYLHSPSVSSRMLQSVLYLHVEYQIAICLRLSPLTPFCSSQKRLLKSLPVASVSYDNCTDKPVTYDVTVQYYCQYYTMVKSIFRIHLYDIKKWY